MNYPESTRFNEYCITTETQKGNRVATVRRWVIYPDGKKVFERYPVKKYADVRDDLDQLKDFVLRLNHRLPEKERTKRTIEIRHAFITPDLIEEYYTHLKTEIPTPGEAQKHFGYTIRYFLQFFINKLDLPDPLQWHKNQTLWAQALLNEFQKDLVQTKADKLRLWDKDHLPAGTTIKEIVNNSNRFMRWLHQQKPDYVTPLQFNPISKAAIKTLDARRQMQGAVRLKSYIDDSDWKAILSKLKSPTYSQIAPMVFLAWNFGLRLSETEGLILKDVRKDYLSVERQLKSVPSENLSFELACDVLKGRTNRKVPYWFTTPLNAHNWVKLTQSNIMHPDTLGGIWSDLMTDLKLPHQFHDIRRTWITRCFRLGKFKGKEILPTDVQLAAGHVNIETTMRYKLDDRAMDDDVFLP